MLEKEEVVKLHALVSFSFLWVCVNKHPLFDGVPDGLWTLVFSQKFGAETPRNNATNRLLKTTEEAAVTTEATTGAFRMSHVQTRRF